MNSSFPKMNQRDYLFECNKDYPNQVILNNRGQKKWTVRQFEAEVDKMSNILKYGFGISKGDIVCTISLSTPELVFLKYACATVGAITCHLNFFDSVLFVVNSKIGKEGEKITGYDIQSVIDSVFVELRIKSWEIVLFPVISGRNVYPRNKSQYIRTIQLILNNFLDLGEEGRGKHLVISLHSKSLKENGYNFEDICKLVEMCIRVDDPEH